MDGDEDGDFYTLQNMTTEVLAARVLDFVNPLEQKSVTKERFSYGETAEVGRGEGRQDLV